MPSNHYGALTPFTQTLAEMSIFPLDEMGLFSRMQSSNTDLVQPHAETVFIQPIAAKPSGLRVEWNRLEPMITERVESNALEVRAASVIHQRIAEEWRKAFDLPVEMLGDAGRTTSAALRELSALLRRNMELSPFFTFTPFQVPLEVSSRRIVNGSVWTVAGRMMQSGQVVPRYYSYISSRRSDLQGNNILGYAMAVVKDDDPTITWDSEAMERGEPWA